MIGYPPGSMANRSDIGGKKDGTADKLRRCESERGQ
jgi:hypothetical protein